MQANLLGRQDFRRRPICISSAMTARRLPPGFPALHGRCIRQDLQQMQHWYDYAGTPQINVTRPMMRRLPALHARHHTDRS